MSDTDDVLATIPLVAGNTHLTDHLFEQLVDLLLEGMLVDLRRQLADASSPLPTTATSWPPWRSSAG